MLWVVDKSVSQWVSESVSQWVSEWVSEWVRDVCISHQSDWIYYKQPIKFLVVKVNGKWEDLIRIEFSQTFYGLVFSYLTITDVTSYVDHTVHLTKSLLQTVLQMLLSQKNNSCTLCVPMFFKCVAQALPQARIEYGRYGYIRL